MLKILIADDHPLILEGIKNTLSREADITVCCTAVDAVSAYECLGRHPHDALVLDITLPGKSGIELLKELTVSQPHLHVLILSMHPEERFAVRVVRSGASGYLTKEAIPTELVKAVRIIAHGGKYITPPVAEALAREIQAPTSQPPHELLSDREYQVFLLIAAGKSSQEIADELCVSPSTVKSYRARVLEKMQLPSNVELSKYALRNKLID